MSKSISILDDDYLQWVQDLCNRYRQSQIKAAVKVNKEMLRFYYELGRDISEKKAESRWGSKFFASLSRDLIAQNPGATCFSPTNLLYMRNFYRLYSNFLEIAQQPAEQMEGGIIITQQLAEQIQNLIFSVPWGHHMYLIDKCSNNPSEALFYVRETVKHGWSRSVLMNMYGTALFDRQGKGETNFIKTLPSQESDLAQEITRDPYCFGFTQLCEPYNERVLKDALITNIEKFLLELLCKGLHNISSRKCCRLSRMDCSKSFSVTKACSFNPKNSKVTGVLITSLGCNKVACCWTKAERASLFLESPLRS